MSSQKRPRDGTMDTRVSDSFFEKMESDVKRMVHAVKSGGDYVHSSSSSRDRPQHFQGNKKREYKPSSSSNEERASKKQKVAPVASPSPAKKPTPAPKPSSSSSSSSSSQIAAPQANEKTVYISGLPFTCTEDDIRDFFKDVGKVQSIRLPRWHDSGNLRGYGHVEFSNKAAADAALELTGQYIKDRYVNVDRPMVPRALQQQVTAPTAPVPHPPGCRTVFIKNLPYDVTEEELRQHFMVFGPIQTIRLAAWNHTSNLKGFGYVDFKREDSAEIAVKKSGTVVIRDRNIVIDYETTGAKGSYRNPLEKKKVGQQGKK